MEVTSSSVTLVTKRVLSHDPHGHLCCFSSCIQNEFAEMLCINTYKNDTRNWEFQLCASNYVVEKAVILFVIQFVFYWAVKSQQKLYL